MAALSGASSRRTRIRRRLRGRGKPVLSDAGAPRIKRVYLAPTSHHSSRPSITHENDRRSIEWPCCYQDPQRHCVEHVLEPSELINEILRKALASEIRDAKKYLPMPDTNKDE